MKCTYCGGEVGLEESVCPYCGRPNEQAVKHVQDMHRFSRRFEDTKTQVLGKARSYSQIVPRILILLFLVIACVVMVIIKESAYGMPEKSRRRAAERNVSTVSAALDACLEQSDYIAFASTFEYNGIRTYGGSFEDYREVFWCADYYKDIVVRLEKILLNADRETWIKNSASYDIRSFCQTIGYFQDSLKTAERNLSEGPMLDHVHAMRDNLEQMLSLYFGIEEPEGFLSLSENRMSAMLEEVLIDEE